ncbi:DUF4349 domain-containing protein [Kitasatospora sp. NPDC056184]|uniref:DUF4349 domain-containing protein n=1 Tax=Kitasatospora sp. NPDC056184 TaxID=3345738 RepID=UPI0035DDE289
MGRGRRRAGALAAVAAAAAALAAGCSASEGGVRDNAAAAPAQAAAGEAAKGDSAPGVPGAAASAAPKAAETGQDPAARTAPVVDARQIAYSAQLTVRTATVDEALARARGLAVAAGGYVSAETASGTGGTGPTAAPQSGQVTVKVPSAAFQQTLDQLAGLGEVLSRRSQAEDLTQQVADVNSRMQSQQASVDRVRALMAQAKTLAEVVSLESELSRREADLESLQKQVKELSARTSLSTITLDVRPQETARPDAPAPEEEDDGFWASVGSALGGGWRVLFAIVRGLFVAVAALLPFLLVAVPIAAVVRVVLRRWTRAAGRTGRDREPVPGFAPPPAEDSTGREPEEEGQEEKPGEERRTP